jgi:hypothetical protein
MAMRARYGIVLLGTLFVATTAAAQMTEMDKFQKKVEKYAAPVLDIFDKPKGLCACIDDPGNADNNGMAGVLDSAEVSTGDVVPRRIRVRCMVIKATNSGNITQAESCENFVPLAK